MSAQLSFLNHDIIMFLSAINSTGKYLTLGFLTGYKQDTGQHIS